jgi:hypothetical protein
MADRGARHRWARSYGAALKELGAEDRQVTGPLGEQPGRELASAVPKRERAMLRFRRMHSLRSSPQSTPRPQPLQHRTEPLQPPVYKQARAAALPSGGPLRRLRSGAPAEFETSSHPSDSTPMSNAGVVLSQPARGPRRPSGCLGSPPPRPSRRDCGTAWRSVAATTRQWRNRKLERARLLPRRSLASPGPQVAQMSVAGREVRRGVADADDGAAVEGIIGKPWFLSQERWMKVCRLPASNQSWDLSRRGHGAFSNMLVSSDPTVTKRSHSTRRWR